MSRHIPVLLEEVLSLLQLKVGDSVIDCTMGDGGHAEAILERTGPKGKLLGLDADAESLLRAKNNLYRFGERVVYARENFIHLQKIVTEQKFGLVQGIVIDLGWSSPQFEERGRGFSFANDEPLDMRFDISSAMTAAEIISSYDLEKLAKLFRTSGEEKLSRDIAQAIVVARRNKPVTRTTELVEIILQVYRTKLRSVKEVPWVGGLHPATKVFQALRIEVNQELAAVKEVLPQAIAALSPGGRLAVITFHSLEDRLVKHYFKTIEHQLVTIITKKPIIASASELQNNPRARSAKLRVVEKI